MLNIAIDLQFCSFFFCIIIVIIIIIIISAYYSMPDRNKPILHAETPISPPGRNH